MGATHQQMAVLARLMFQFTHPRWVRRFCATAIVGQVSVSIHAPAMGATEVGELLLRKAVVSIHAPAMGATGDELLVLL